MSRSKQTGSAAPRQGTMIRQTRFGAAAYDIPAVQKFPAPEFLTTMQKSIWTAALSDISSEFFRARHIPIMIQYVRTLARMMDYSDELENDPEDNLLRSKWLSEMNLAMKLEKHLSFGSGDLIMLVVRARTEMKLAHQQKNAREAADDDNPQYQRQGLTYVGH